MNHNCKPRLNFEQFCFLGNAASAAALPWGKISLFVATSMLGDQSVTKRLAMLSMACLRASGTIRAFAELKSRDLKVKELYESLGFSSIRIGKSIFQFEIAPLDDKLKVS